MIGLATAVERREWKLVSLYLLLGIDDAASRLPAESLIALVDLLGGTDVSGKRDRRGGR